MNYTSPIKIGKLPLISIVLKKKKGMKRESAIGIIAIGQYAYGVITISQFGIGVVSMSQFGLGLVGVFQFGIAGFSIAQFAVNLFSGYGQFVINCFGN